jgi:hypothetical protein
MTNGNELSANLITLAIVLLVIVRFLFRELRERKVRVRTLWIRPGILAVLLLVLLAGGFAIPRIDKPVMLLSALAGAAIGVVVGALVVRSTTFAPAGERGAVLAKGSIVTVMIWVVAIVLRLAARYTFAGFGADQASQFELNAGLVALVTAAFIVVAILFHREIDRLSPAATGAPTPTP